MSTQQSIDLQLFEILDNAVDSEQLYLNPGLQRADLCKIIGVEKNRFGQIMRQCAGVDNCVDYLNRKRIVYAKQMLLDHPEYCIRAIGRDSGMKSHSAFYRAFTKYTGQTPTEYKESQKSSNNDQPTQC